MSTARINTYTCPQRHVTVTRDVDDGVTPMYKNCPTCGHPARSAYYLVDQSLTPTHEWYRPRFPDRYTNAVMREHCKRGGLAFRAVGEGDETETMPWRSATEGKTAKTIFHRLTNTKQ